MSKQRIQNSSESENTCVVCFKNVNYYSIGDCDHPVCFECSTRMRVLCCQNECPICRQDMPKVIFTTRVETFIKLKPRAQNVNLLDKRYGIYFMSSLIEATYLNLLEHRCPRCDSEPFRTFHQLREHVRRQHEMFYCDLCTENLKIFSFERRCYTRSLLVLHRRKGDPDDKSHKGHPLCEFCDQRYMDNDDLYRHLRRDHLNCHFCDADGKHHYYSSYQYLREHFQNEHYLCEEGECRNEQFTSVFRSEIDLKAHKASVHGKELGKVGTKQARTLELEFRLAPRPRVGDQQNQQQPVRQSRVPPPSTLGQHLGLKTPSVIDDWPDEEGAMGLDVDNDEATSQANIQKKPINALDPELFPTLNGAPAPVISSIASKPLTRTSGAGITIRHTRQGLAKTDENFPALTNEVPTSTLRFSVNTPSTSGMVQTKAPNVSIHVNHRPNLGVTARVSQLSEPTQKVAPPPMELSDAFPALGSPTKNHHAIQPAQWVTQKPKSKQPEVVVPLKPALPVQQTPKDLNSTKDFPSLSKTSNSTAVKKTTSLTVPVTNTWSSEDSSTKSLEEKTKNKKKKSKSSSPENLNSTPIPTSAKSKTKKNDNSKQTEGALNNKNNTATTNNKNEKKKVAKEEKKVEKKTEPKEIKKTENKKENKITPPKNGTVERKTSKLNIGNLKTPIVNGDTLENDFPALGNASNTTIKKPPGFDTWSTTKSTPPPGFSNKPPPPPGFTSQDIAQSANDLTFTNSSGQKYPILPHKNTTSNEFHPPPHSTQRNRKLIENFMTALSDGDLNEFRQLSHFYKQGSYSAKNYYDYCKKVLGNQFETIFPELLVLLPDIQKQNELYNIHKKQKTSNKIAQLEKCAVCEQIISASDLRLHFTTHTMENHFPALNVGGGASAVSTAWRK